MYSNIQSNIRIFPLAILELKIIDLRSYLLIIQEEMTEAFVSNAVIKNRKFLCCNMTYSIILGITAEYCQLSSL